MAGRASMVTAPASAIHTEGLTRRYGRTEAVHDVTLDIGRGEIFGIVGPDGAGKTTLVQMLCGILNPSGGRATVLGLDVAGSSSDLAAQIGYMSQAFSLYGGLSVAENIEFFADLHGVPSERRRKRAERLLSFSRLAPFAGRLAHNLSGGMQKKLALATVLIHDPGILFLDEPTTGVDPMSRRDFWEIVFDFVAEGTTVVLATPYLDEAERCTRVAFMHEGELVKVDTPAALRRSLGGYMTEIWTATQRSALDLLRTDPRVRDAQVFGGSIHALLVDQDAYRPVHDRLRRNGIIVDVARRIEPGLEDVFVSLLDRRARPSSNVRLATPSPPNAQTDTVGRGEPGSAGKRISAGPELAIQAAGLGRKFGRFQAVQDVSFTVAAGEVFGILGPNGSGKSTTIRMLTGILRASTGRASICGFDVRQDRRRIRPLLGYMSQKFSLYDDLTAEENLDFFGGLYGVPRRERRARKRWALDLVGWGADGTARVADLAGGWRQRLALAAAVLHRPRVLLLDEPTSGVDPLSRRAFWDLIFTLAGDGVTVLVTTHYMDEAERCQRLAFLDGGRLVALGTSAELRARIPGRMLEIEVARPIAALRTVRDLDGVRQGTLLGSRLHVLLREGRGEDWLRAHLKAAGFDIGASGFVPLGMEDIFTAVVDGARRSSARARPA